MTAIKHYTISTPGIGGEIKRRIADFRVREITPKGEICPIKAFTADEKLAVEKKWPEELESETIILQMEKFNIDVNNAIRKVTRFLQVSNKRFGYAGMKDKRAITSQRISLWKPNLEKLKTFESRYIDLRFLGFGERVKIGDLWGNSFEITIRNIKGEKEALSKEIEKCFEEMKAGIQNYFGEQRFGGAREISHLVGKEFVKRNFEKGIMLYLTSTFPAEEESIKNARLNLAKTTDFVAATKEFPAKFRYERSILHHLCKYPKDFVNAFRKLPKPLTYMFTHAYQSYLFNKVINKRIEKGLGIEAVEGDILIEGLQPTAPLVGFETKFATGTPGEIEKAVLEEEGIELADFKIKEFPELSSKGARKSIVLIPEELKLIGVEEDEFNSGMLKATVSFRLSKGNYATTVLRELMKNK